MEIKKVNHNTIDVFIGNGWENWGRFKIAHKQDGVHLYQVGGNRFPEKTVKTLATHYS